MDSEFGSQSQASVSSRWGIVLRRTAEGLLVSFAYALSAVVLLHPWFSDPTRRLVTLGAGGGGVEVADVNLVMWILSWDWHALTTAPLHLFDANIFYPASNTLAASEHLLGHVAIFGPVYGLSGNPVLAYQVNFLANLALSGAALYALLRHWRLPVVAAFFGGFLYAFSPFRMHTANYPHLFAGQYAPLALLFLDQTLVTERVRSAVAFGLFVLMQMLCSYYLAFMMLVALGGYGCGILWASRGRLSRRGVLLAGAAAIAAGLVFAAFSLPYVRFRSTGTIPDSTDLRWLKLFSAGPFWAFLNPKGPLYVGIVPFVLALLGLRYGLRTPGRVPWARAATIGLTVACYVMAFGPELDVGEWRIPLPYGVAMHVIPGFSSMRAPVRFVLMGALGFATLSAFGAAWSLRRLRTRWGSRIAGSLVVLAAVVSAWEYGLLSDARQTRPVRIGADMPEVYRALAAAPHGPVLEVPPNHFFGHFRGAIVASGYMFYSTFHWDPLLNGYSAYPPPSSVVTRALIAALPDEEALRLLRRTTGLRYVVLHRELLPPSARGRWRAPPGLRLRGRYGQDLLFEVRDRVEPDLLEELVQTEPRHVTLTGTPIVPLPKDARRARFELDYTAQAVITDYPVPVDVTITNESRVKWPALATVAEHLVTLGYRWEDAGGNVLAAEPAASRLAYDLAPGESVRQRIAAIAPAPGQARLVIGLVQDGEWFPDTTEPLAIDVLPGSALAALVPDSKDRKESR